MTRRRIFILERKSASLHFYSFVSVKIHSVCPSEERSPDPRFYFVSQYLLCFYNSVLLSNFLFGHDAVFISDSALNETDPKLLTDILFMSLKIDLYLNLFDNYITVCLERLESFFTF